MSRQLFLRYMPVLLLAILLAEFFLHWWPGAEIESLRTGRRLDSHGWAAVQLQGLHLRFLAVFAACLGIASHVIRVCRPPNAPKFPGFGLALRLAIGSYFLAQVLWALPIDYRASLRYIPLQLILALIFKISAVIFLYQVLRRGTEQRSGPQWANTLPAEGPAKPETVLTQHTFRTTIAVALVMYVLFPLWDVIQSIGINWRVSFSVPPGLAMAGKFAVSVILAITAIKVGSAGGVLRPQPDTRPAKYAYRLLVVFLILAPVAVILSAIPYGGGSVPAGLRLLISAAQILGLWTLYVLLNKANSNASQIADGTATT